MTSFGVYALAWPFVVLGLGWLAVWWNHRENERNRPQADAGRPAAG